MLTNSIDDYKKLLHLLEQAQSNSSFGIASFLFNVKDYNLDAVSRFKTYCRHLGFQINGYYIDKDEYIKVRILKDI